MTCGAADMSIWTGLERWSACAASRLRQEMGSLVPEQWYGVAHTGTDEMRLSQYQCQISDSIFSLQSYVDSSSTVNQDTL